MRFYDPAGTVCHETVIGVDVHVIVSHENMVACISRVGCIFSLVTDYHRFRLMP
jgi:hypothetical protein